ncbi:MAG: TIGR04282 family arsenosugar biosynthesis glycosyltransferase [Acidobacteria bacterium]|nr:TIGR04282 family arsenosugar biosynthesis glycosyltransferase [Acidobacteriota bacterium]
MSTRRLLLFAKAPVPGRVKTRLVAPGGLTAGGAASLHRALVADLAHRLNAGPWELVLMWASSPDDQPPAGLAPADVRWRRQEGRDLGERLYGGLRWAADGADHVAAVGSDHPDLDSVRVEEAFAALDAGRGAVLGPAADGGYYLIALRREALCQRLFEGIAWGGPSVLAATLSRVDELGLDAALLPEAHDLDTVADLGRFRERLACRPELRSLCPRTAEVLL